VTPGGPTAADLDDLLCALDRLDPKKLAGLKAFATKLYGPAFIDQQSAAADESRRLLLRIAGVGDAGGRVGAGVPARLTTG